jgi:hypothetical protein
VALSTAVAGSASAQPRSPSSCGRSGRQRGWNEEEHIAAKPRPTERRIELGYVLRQLRQRAGLAMEEAAAAPGLRMILAKLQRIEAGLQDLLHLGNSGSTISCDRWGRANQVEYGGLFRLRSRQSNSRTERVMPAAHDQAGLMKASNAAWGNRRAGPSGFLESRWATTAAQGVRLRSATSTQFWPLLSPYELLNRAVPPLASTRLLRSGGTGSLPARTPTVAS